MKVPSTAGNSGSIMNASHTGFLRHFISSDNIQRSSIVHISFRINAVSPAARNTANHMAVRAMSAASGLRQ